MKAVRIHEYGGPEVLQYEDAPEPVPGEGEVLIRVHATSVNPFDAALRAGYLAEFITPEFPLILGTDIAGTVQAIGDGVEGFTEGDGVYGRGGVFRDGAYAQFVALPASDTAALPQTLDQIEAAALPHVALTAWQALFELADLRAGQTILVHGAGGGVGHIAVQLAKWRGAKVVGTGSVNVDFVRDLGVDEAIDYQASDFEDEVGDVDVVLDTVGGETQERSWATLKDGGILVSIVQPPSAETADRLGVRGAFVTSAPPISETLTELAELVDSGIVKPEVSVVRPLNEVRQAHEQIEQRHTRGKIVLEVG